MADVSGVQLAAGVPNGAGAFDGKWNMASELVCCCEVMSAEVAGTGTKNVTVVTGPAGYFWCCSTMICGCTGRSVRTRSLHARAWPCPPHAIQQPDCVLT